jgi:hypothetical protein
MFLLVVVAASEQYRREGGAAYDNRELRPRFLGGKSPVYSVHNILGGFFYKFNQVNPSPMAQNTILRIMLSFGSYFHNKISYLPFAH